MHTNFDIVDNTTKMATAFLAIFILLSLAGCGSKPFDIDTCEAGLKLGMSESEVRKVCGAPYHSGKDQGYPGGTGPVEYKVYGEDFRYKNDWAPTNEELNPRRYNRVYVIYQERKVVYWMIRRKTQE